MQICEVRLKNSIHNMREKLETNEMISELTKI